MKKYLIIIGILLGLQSLVEAQTQEDYLRIAAENNPELKASFNRYLAAMEKVPQVGSLPDPQLTFGFFTMPMEFALMGKQRAEISLMQMFPWFGMLRTQKDEATLMARGEYENFREVKNRIFYEVKHTWHELHRLEEEIRITQQNLELMRTLERYALVRFQSGSTATPGGNSSGSMPSRKQSSQPSQSMGSSMGDMGNNTSQGTANQGRLSDNMNNMNADAMNGSMGSGSGMADVLRVQMEIKEMENMLADLQDARKPMVSKFNQLLFRDPEAQVALTDTFEPIDLPADQLVRIDSMMKSNPMLRMLESEKEAFAVQERMARLEGRPMIGAGVNYMVFSPRQGEAAGEMHMGGRNMVMPMVSVTLPIYRKKYNAMQKEASLRRDAIENQQQHIARQLLVQWEEAQRDYRSAQRSIRLYQQQIKLTEQTLRLLTTAYSVEGKAFDELLRTQQQLLDYQLRLVNAIIAQHTAVTEMEMLAATGID